MALAIPDGVVVGDPLGPLLFILYYSGFLRDLQARRKQSCPNGSILGRLAVGPAGRGGDGAYWESTELTDMAFVDDQATHRVVQNWGEVAAELALQRQVLREWGMEPQLDKCGVMVRWAGRGAKELRSRPPAHVG